MLRQGFSMLETNWWLYDKLRVPPKSLTEGFLTVVRLYCLVAIKCTNEDNNTHFEQSLLKVIHGETLPAFSSLDALA